jgi:hypothetical protein
METRKMDIDFQLRMLVFQRKIAKQQLELIMEAEGRGARPMRFFNLCIH